MAFIKIYIHLVFSTKNRDSFLNTFDIPLKVRKHIKEYAIEKGIFLDMINGYSDHCHCLISLGSDQNIEKIVQLLKGESSHWINKNKLTLGKFSWQDEYFAVSLSESMVESVRNYIKNQEKHHQKKALERNIRNLLKDIILNTK
ncbi:IS200/IS605 family transposase [uncultured Chryseobacterium sp.]|uniref:IS200/IS605 family transposase n=1 Tax=uncultured Chryseobacterium sp. TaxID=259322 RepID=UPI0025878A89|nr:IS200/IS605 family transposase [uncultured Chryseobacterium sp.]